MDKNMDFPGFQGFQNFSPFDMGADSCMNDMYKDPIFNPMMQYEQGYMYYRYLAQQMEYKIKCKEYERMCGTRNDGRTDRKVE